jgi:proteasome lid subunit RPN8/RPN11
VPIFVILARFPILTKPYRLHIPHHLYEAMLAQAVSESPNESCGLLAGTFSDGVGVATHRFPLVNAAENPTVEYFSDPKSMLAAHRAMRDSAVEMLAIYHSHPTTAPIPSRTDRERNWWGDAMVFLIVSPIGGRPEVRAWRLTAADAIEVEWKLIGSKDGDVKSGL